MKTENFPIHLQSKIRYLQNNHYPEEIIDFACSPELRYDRKYRLLIWVARERKKQILNVENVNSVLDYYNAGNSIPLATIDFTEAFKLADKWQNELKKATTEYENLMKIPLSQENIVYSSRGYHIVVLDTEVQKNISYSIRDSKNIPQATFSVYNNDDGLYLSAFYGKTNTFPNLIYLQILDDWIKTKINMKLHLDIFYKAPKEIFQLKNITSLEISNYSLAELPEEIRNFINLKELIISGKDFKELPDWIEEFTELEILVISGNEYVRLPENIRKLKKLKQLRLLFIKLKFLPHWIGELTELEKLHISFSKLKKLPKSIKKLRKLKELDLIGNNLKELPDGIGELTDLENLEIPHNEFVRLPESIGKLTKLKRLAINSNPLKIGRAHV